MKELTISVQGEEAVRNAAWELEELAEQIRNAGTRGRAWKDLLPLWERVRAIESGMRWMSVEPERVPNCSQLGSEVAG